jgi:hypothetical protein
VLPVRYELGFYIPEDRILHSHRRDHLKSYIQYVEFDVLTMMTVQCGENLTCHQQVIS